MLLTKARVEKGVTAIRTIDTTFLKHISNHSNRCRQCRFL